MFKDLAAAIKQLAVASSGLTHELGLWREQRNRDLATKADVRASEGRIIEALGERVDPAKLKNIIGKVEAGKLKVQGAVDENK